MSFTVALSSPSISPSPLDSFTNSHPKKTPSSQSFLLSLKPSPPLLASRTFSSFLPVRDALLHENDSRLWSSSINTEFLGINDDDDDDDDEEEERSLDLLVKFVENVFRKISKRARKAVRSVLPVSVSANLVGFAVNGVLILAFLWILKAFLEVICTLGSVVFVSILLIRVVWSGVAYLQESRYIKMDRLDDDRRAWTGTQPAT